MDMTEPLTPSARGCYNTGMKTLLYLFGLFLAAMAFVAVRSASRHDWDVIELAIGAAFLVGSVAVLRAVGRRIDSTQPPR